jgi:ribosomal protein RSM22 (predicted rRNA methylase)
MSFVLNESGLSPEIWADRLIEAWGRHLEKGGLVILCEPALRLQSRRLLELRKILIERSRQPKGPRWLKVLTPCLGHQACGALASPDDWCHEEVLWWRPPYLRELDKLAGLDRKSLPFSHLVITRSEDPIENLLPALQDSTADSRYRLVSPPHTEGKDLEFFICGQDGKRRSRFRPETAQMRADKACAEGEESIQRGTLLLGAELRGDPKATRIDTIRQLR